MYLKLRGQSGIMVVKSCENMPLLRLEGAAFLSQHSIGCSGRSGTKYSIVGLRLSAMQTLTSFLLLFFSRIVCSLIPKLWVGLSQMHYFTFGYIELHLTLV